MNKRYIKKTIIIVSAIITTFLAVVVINEPLSFANYGLDYYSYKYEEIKEEILFYAFCTAIFVLVVGAIFVLPTILGPINKGLKKMVYNDSRAEKKIKQYIPYFNTNDFLEGCFYVYSNVQKAWMLFKIDYVKDMLTHELFSEYRTSLIKLNVKNEQNILKDFNVLEQMIKDVIVEDDIITITTEFKIELYDYVINQSTEEVVKGSKNQKITATYEMKFCKDLKQEKSKWLMADKKTISQDIIY